MEIIVLTEFAEKGSVKDKLDEEGLPESTAIKYFYQAAQGLTFLHSQQIPILHRDVKAANLLLTSSDNVKLANFGLVRDLTIGGFGLAVASEITEDFRFTLLYVAPEVLTNELGPAEPSTYGTPSDVWALGCTFVEMLTRFPPYFEFYDENIGFYNDFIARAKSPIEKQLPYDCFSLVPTASTSVRFIVNKVFDKSPSTRIHAEGLVNFLNAVEEDNISRTSILCKSISYVVLFVFIGLGTLATFFCLSFGVIVLVRLIVAEFCECDLNAPQVLIISGIFLILLFALFFSCCMVALGEYKFRAANKSLHKSRFFVRRPSRDIRFFGVKVVKGKKKDFNSDKHDDASELGTIFPEESEIDKFYYSSLSQVLDSSDNTKNTAVIEEELSRKMGTSKMQSKDLQDLYGDQPSPKF